MGKKERNYNPAEAQRKLDKKREKQKAKENVKQSQTARAAAQELRAIEQEMTLFLTSNTDIKLAHSAAFQAKLGQINDARIKLNLSTKGVDDFQAQFKEIKKQRKDAKKQEQVASSRPKVDQLSNRAEFHAMESAASDKDESAEKDYDERDLSAITLPISGTALETEGQMYHGLTQLRVIKCSKVLLAKKEAARKQKQLLYQKQQQPHHHPYNHQSSLIPPPPPILGAFPFPGFMLPMGGMLPLLPLLIKYQTAIDIHLHSNLEIAQDPCIITSNKVLQEQVDSMLHQATPKNPFKTHLLLKLTNPLSLRGSRRVKSCTEVHPR